MSCELIRIDFKNKVVRSRASLKEAEYDPSKCRHFKDIMEGAKTLALDAYKAGIDPQRIVVVLADPLQNYGTAIYDQDRLDMILVADTLDFMTTKLTRLANEDLDH